MEIKELVEKITRALVGFPDEIHVEEIEATNVKVLEIKVSRRDMKYLVGKRGKNIDALKRIVSVAAKDQRYIVKVIDPRYC